MKIRMTVGLSGNEYSLGPGDERDFPDAEAIRLIDAGFATPVAEVKIERAMAETASERRGRGARNVADAKGGDAVSG